MRILRTTALAAALALGLPIAAHAAGEVPKPPAQNWSFGGLFGTFDRASAQRGFQVYKEVCAACHAMKQISYRNLADIGLSDAEIRAIAADVQVKDGPNDDGDMFERPGRPSDRFRSPFANEKAARAVNNGAYPVDLSLIIKARGGGADYLYALLTGYRDEPPEGVPAMDGMHWNDYFPGHWIAMGRPLNDDQVTFADGTPATTSQMARDLTTFMAWAAEPELEERRAMGVRVILFLIILAGMTYGVKRKIWADLKH
ncbi:cytochrome c1 [Elioraea sp.]|uniref:cytochrome c1 n=1 Tax=Elioraea sp. TaxID=2185103 RepID=UPI0025BF5BCE|nr:cytochrome c1 [Elioraea sp.]